MALLSPPRSSTQAAQGYYQDPVTGNSGPSTFGENYGDIYGPVQQMQNPQQGGQPKQQPEQEGGQQQRTGGGPNYVSVGSFGGGGGLNYDELGPYTREVQDEELVKNQLQGLLASDSPYIQQAVRQGERAAARRGALSSSIFAGASQAAAIQAALPIAAQDAKTFSRVYSENAAAINNNTLAEMQSRTNIMQSNIAAHASITSSAIAANAQLQLGEMEIQAAEEAREFNAAHEEAMTNLEYGLRGDLLSTEYGLRGDLAQQEFGYQLQRDELANQYALQQIGHRGTVESYLTNMRLKGSLVGGLMDNYFANMRDANQYGFDEPGYQAFMENNTGAVNAILGLYNTVMGGGAFDFSGGGGG